MKSHKAMESHKAMKSHKAMESHKHNNEVCYTILHHLIEECRIKKDQDRNLCTYLGFLIDKHHCY